MTAKKPSGRDRPDRLWLCLLPMAAQFGCDLGIQHLFQPGQGLGDQGRIGNPVIPADHDIDGLVLFHHAITEDKRARAERKQLARPKKAATEVTPKLPNQLARWRPKLRPTSQARRRSGSGRLVARNTFLNAGT